MKGKSILAIVFLALTTAGCARSLEEGWSKEDAGEKAAAVKSFSRALIDSEESYRRLAAEELVKLGEPAVPALGAVLLRRGHYYNLYYSGARKEAAWALGEIGSPKAVPSLLRSLQRAGESYREEDIIPEIKDLKGRAALAKMVKDIAARSQGKDQIAMAKIIRRDLEEIEQLIQAAFSDKNDFYREEELTSAISRIELLPLSGEEGKKVKEETLKVVKGRLEAKRSSGPPELIAGIDALGEIGDKSAVESLLALLKETYTRGSAALALARIGDRRALPFLKEGWRKEKEESIKMSLEAALYLMGDESKWETLVERLGDRRLRKEAIEFLGEIGDEKGTAPLIEVLSDESPEIRLKVIKALSRIGGREAEGALLRALNDNDPVVKKEAILTVVNSEKSRDALRKMVTDEGEELRVRLAAASRLGEWEDKSGLSLTRKVGKDNTYSDEEKAVAIAALGRIGEGEEILRETYQDRGENYLIRFEARKALRMMREGKR